MCVCVPKIIWLCAREFFVYSLYCVLVGFSDSYSLCLGGGGGGLRMWIKIDKCRIISVLILGGNLMSWLHAVLQVIYHDSIDDDLLWIILLTLHTQTRRLHVFLTSKRILTKISHTKKLNNKNNWPYNIVTPVWGNYWLY